MALLFSWKNKEMSTQIKKQFFKEILCNGKKLFAIRGKDKDNWIIMFNK